MQGLTSNTSDDTETRIESLASGTATQTEQRCGDTTVETDDVAAVTRLLAQRRFSRRPGLTVWAWTLAAPVAALTILLNLASNNSIPSLYAAFVLLTAFTLNRQANELAIERAAFLAYEEIGKERIGALVDALTWPDRRIRAIARRCLTRRLPTLRPGDEHLLNREQRAGLYRYLNIRSAATDPEFVRAILEALPLVGDRRALRGVERLTHTVSPTRRMRQIRFTARAGIGLLEQRAERELAADQLSSVGAEAQASHESQASEHEPVVISTPVGVEAQLLAFEEEQKKVQKPGMRLAFLIASWCVIVPYCAVESIAFFREGSWPAAMLFGAMALATTQLHRLTLTARHRRLAERLAEIDDIHGVGRLAEALEWPDPEVKELVADALTRLLPRMQASDSALLNAAQRGCLYRMLDISNAAAYSDLLLSLLKALQQIGDRSAVGAVERLAHAEPITTRQRWVQQAAVECLPFLQSLAEQTRYSATLLRASSASDTPSDLLLRSVNSATADDQAELLRAEP